MITCILLQYIECLIRTAMRFSIVAISRALHRVAFREDYGKRGSARAAVFGAFGPDEGAQPTLEHRSTYDTEEHRSKQSTATGFKYLIYLSNISISVAIHRLNCMNHNIYVV